MLNSLRNRLILSHILPVLVVSPLMGLALIFFLETQILLPTLSSDMEAEASLVAQTTEEKPGLWGDPSQAQAFVQAVAPRLGGRLELISKDGTLIAVSGFEESAAVGQPVSAPDLSRALAGQVVERTTYSRDLQVEAADVMVPVLDAQGKFAGVVRLTHRLSTVIGWFLRLRYLIAVIIGAGIVVGTALGWYLAVSINRPLKTITDAVVGLANGEQIAPVKPPRLHELELLGEAFNGLVERLRVLEKTRRELLASIVHELARPMGAILSATQALQAGAHGDTELREELLAGIAGEVVRLRRLLDNLAQLHDRVLGAPELAKRPTSFGDWLHTVLVPWREAAREKGLEWGDSVPDGLPEVEIDPDRMAQAVGNLLSNAVKYTPEGGAIAVSAGLAAEGGWIRVSDTGPGIETEELERVFVPLYRGGQARRFPQGMGLGLSIARDIVAAHGGRIEVGSNPGGGSAFTISFPIGTRSEQSSGHPTS